MVATKAVQTRMRRTWTTIAAEHNSTTAQRSRLAGCFDALVWRALPVEVGMMPGENIKAAISELNLPKVSHIAVSHELAPYGLYGIRCRYSDGLAQVYLIDEGSQCSVLASDFWKE